MPTSILSTMRCVHRLDDARGLAHVVDLGRALDRALPVDQRRRVDEARIRQVLLQRREGGGGEPVIVHLDADRQLVPAALGDAPADRIVHRMALGRLHIVVGIADDVVVRRDRRCAWRRWRPGRGRTRPARRPAARSPPGGHRTTSRHSRSASAMLDGSLTISRSTPFASMARRVLARRSAYSSRVNFRVGLHSCRFLVCRPCGRSAFEDRAGVRRAWRGRGRAWRSRCPARRCR